VKVGELYGIPFDYRIKEIEDLKPKEGELIVKVKSSGICSSDVKMAKRGHPILDLYGLPFIGGHEFSGEVIELGKNVEDVRIGNRVVVSWITPCLECYYCKLGLFQFCLEAKNTLIQPAGFSEKVKIPKKLQKTRIFKFSDRITYEQAAMTEPVACALNGINNAGVKIADTVVILGMGVMGLLLLQLAKLAGAANIIAVDVVKKRLNIAKELGANYVINFKKEDTEKAVMYLTENFGADIVIEAVGHISAYRQAVMLGRKGSTVLYFGGLPSGLMLDIDPNIIHYKQLTIKGSYSYTTNTFKDALKLIETGRVEVSKLITDHYKLDDLKEAVKKAGESDSLKVMLNFN